ncbi:MAG TPA: class I SAM-dependent methyltransferase [Roseiarcus sp.]|nr:class I SAM-dependent methyltransferase [Roseiarcus sp.]
MSELKRIFEHIAARNKWRNRESRSGDGSTLFYTRHLRGRLESFVREFDIRTFFDAPCGDFNWMRAVAFPPRLTYIGGDIALALIKENRKRYSEPRRRFLQFDIASDPFPAADVWFCRDCLFHLPDALILRALRNFCDSKIKLLMMTNHINREGFANSDIKAGGFRLVDFFGAPYNLPRDVLFRVTDYIEPYPPREMCVWTREQIAAALAGTKAALEG